MPPQAVDALVIGAGPAGTTAARLLREWGHDVLLVHRRPQRHSLAESLPPSAKKLLAFLGALDVVEAARFHPNFGNVSRWGGRSSVTNTAQPGYHVSRAQFDRVLRTQARSSRVPAIEGIVRSVRHGQDDVAVECLSDTGEMRQYHARVVLDCSGRTGVVARRGLRRHDGRPSTIAIAAEWTSGSWPSVEQDHTVIESYHDGWAWSVPLSPATRQCTVMIDPSRVRKGLSLQAIYGAELAKTEGLIASLAGATQQGPAWACDASTYDSVRAADDGILLVGDAASFIEPLSSAGVKKALTSAWRAAVVVNTCLSKPDMAGWATQLHVSREREIYEDCTRRATQFFREVAHTCADSFWTARASICDEFDASEARVPWHASSDDFAMRQAFEVLRSTARVQLRPATTLQFAQMPVIDGREVVLREAIIAAQEPTPMQLAGGVNLPALVHLVERCDNLSSLTAAYNREFGAATTDGLLGGLSLLIARGALVQDNSRLIP